MSVGKVLKSPLAYIIASYSLLVLYALDYANVYRQFFPTVVALSNSSAFRMLCTNGVIASVVLTWVVTRLIFFGKLHVAESNALKTVLPMYIAECILGPLYFNQSLFSFTTVATLWTLVFRLLNRLAGERLTTISTVEDRRQHWNYVVRLAVFLTVSTMVNMYVVFELWNALSWDLGFDTALVCACGILVYGQLEMSVIRYSVQLLHLELAGEDSHTPVTFYVDSVSSIVESIVFLVFFVGMSIAADVPLLLIRNFIEHVISLHRRTTHLYSYWQLTSRVHQIPDATEADIERDPRCTICYDDMTAGSSCKRLPCGHCYHERCLKRWFEGHSTCPYCRTDLLRDAQNTTAAQATPNAPAPPPAAEVDAVGEDYGVVEGEVVGDRRAHAPYSPIATTAVENEVVRERVGPPLSSPEGLASATSASAAAAAGSSSSGTKEAVGSAEGVDNATTAAATTPSSVSPPSAFSRPSPAAATGSASDGTSPPAAASRTTTTRAAAAQPATGPGDISEAEVQIAYAMYRAQMERADARRRRREASAEDTLMRVLAVERAEAYVTFHRRVQEAEAELERELNRLSELAEAAALGHR